MLKSVQCAVQGRGHEKNGIPCQDKTFAMEENGVSVVALADGAGSASFSHLGADCVTRTICREMVEHFDRFYEATDPSALRQEVLQTLLSALNLTAEEQGCDLSELASTLLMVAVKDSRYLMLHLGDGVIGYLRHGELYVASHPTNGEFANVTYFVTSPDAASRMKLFKGRMETIRGFVLMSDGAEASLYNKREKSLAPVLGKLIDAGAQKDVSVLQESLQQSFASVVRHATQDDCSMAMLVDDKEGFPGVRALSRWQRRQLLDMPRHRSAASYHELLEFALAGQSLVDISRHMHLKKRYTQKRVQRLLALRLLVRVGELYRTNVLM